MLRRGAWIGALGGAVVAGAAGATVAGVRRAHSRRDVDAPSGRAPGEPGRDDVDPPAPSEEEFPPWPAGPGVRVRTGDGLHLHAEVTGRLDAGVTLVFVHGYGLSRRSFRFQRRDLADDARLVFYDHRSHGGSDRAPAATCTIDQLGDDLAAVVEQLGGDGPVVLVGHSLGGMTVLALADRHPDLFADRVAGVALLSTSAGRLSEVTLGLPKAAGVVLRRVRPGHLVGLSRGLPLLLAVSQLTSSPRRAAKHRDGLSLSASVIDAVVHRFSFGGDVHPALVADVQAMIGATGWDVLAAFAPTFLDHDKLAALPTVGRVPVEILVGDADLMTPVAHSRTLASELPTAELMVLPGVGHMVPTERPAEVAAALRRLLRRAAAADPSVAGAQSTR